MRGGIVKTKLFGAALVGLLMIGCSSTGSAAKRTGVQANDRDTMTQRQRDSVLSTQKAIPGAAGVMGALKASDAVQKHNAEIDSLSH